MVSKDMFIGDILRKDPGNGIAQILMRAKMGCVGCPAAARETLEQAVMIHPDIDPDSIVEEINLYLQTVQA
jgi:hybrid cluster-associated redox disulfide protein